MSAASSTLERDPELIDAKAVNQHQEVISSGPNHKKTSFAVFIKKFRV
jgi:hypothetical protein